MDEKQAEEILQRYLAGTATDKEKSAVEAWYNELPYKTGSPSYKQITNDRSANWNIIASNTTVGSSNVPFWKKYAVAASIAIAVFTGGYFYYQSQILHPKSEFVNTSDIAPGKNGATLTLANGKKIYINDALVGNLASEAGVKISKTKDGQLIYEVTDSDNDVLAYNTLTTTRGEQSQVRLPDGSLVFLNAGSSLKYPTSFARQAKRLVSLSGEAYFEVAKDRLHPFIVSTDKQQVEVLGTHFNINSYADEAATVTTLIEGSVRVVRHPDVSASENIAVKVRNDVVLKPGQQSLNNEAGMKVQKAEIENTIDWKDGDFNFDNVDFRTAMRKVARWYDVEVVYDKSVPMDMTAGGWVSRQNNISAVLKSIEKAGLVRFKVEGKKVFVYK